MLDFQKARDFSLRRSSTSSRALILALVALAPLAVSGCKNTRFSDITGSIAGDQDSAKPDSDEQLRRYTEQLGKRYDASPHDKTAAMDYARALRLRGQNAQAVAVLQTIAIRHPKDEDVLAAYGKALADAGRLDEASEVLRHAQTPERPNWSVLSAQGSVADRVGDHASARAYYQAALKIAPDEPSILSNLGLSYALTKELPKAEDALRRAAASPKADVRVRENLSLVLALEGKYTEAEQFGARDLPPEQARANVAAVRAMMAQANTWSDLRDLDGKKPARRVAAKSGGSVAVAREARPAAEPAEALPAAQASAADPAR